MIRASRYASFGPAARSAIDTARPARAIPRGVVTRRLVVHVGTAKAGSTSVQTMLDARQDSLRACGIRVLGGMRRGSGQRPGALLVRGLAEASGDHGRRRAWRRLEEQIRRSKADRFVLSVEKFTSRAVRVRCAARLQELAASGHVPALGK